MRKGLRLWLLSFVFITVLLMAFTGTLYAQDAQVEDTFEKDSLNDYDHSQDVLISEGSVKIGPGNFLFRLGQWANPEIDVKLKKSSDSSVVLNYHASDQGSYGLEIIDFDSTEIILFAESGGQRDELGFYPVDESLANTWNEVKIKFAGGLHQVSLNGQKIIEVQDNKNLGPGAVGIRCDGGNPVLVDSISIKGSEAATEQVSEEENITIADEEGSMQSPQQEASTETVTETQKDQESTSWKSLLGQLFVSGAPQIDMKTFLINLGLSALLAYILGLVYIHWGASLSNRRKFATNFILLTVTTTFIILVVRSSVALSLGLVGALSIVRFRAAIKEPEELAYLFLAIGLGIGLGDNQRIITLIAFAVAVAILGLLKLFRKAQADVNLHLNISLEDPEDISISHIQKILKPHVSKIKLLRFDRSKKAIEMSFLVEFRKIDDLNAARNDLERLSKDINITFLDNKGIW